MLWPAIANECGEEALTKIANYEEGSFNNEGVLKALSHIKEIADKGYLLEGTVGMNHTVVSDRDDAWKSCIYHKRNLDGK